MDKNIICQKLQKIRYKDINIKIDDFRGEIRPYQKAGILFSYYKKISLLADEQGLGKFIQFLGLRLYMKQKEKNYKTLFVTFASLKHQAKNEIDKFSGDTLKTVVIPSRLNKIKREKLWYSQGDIFIINYELLYRDIDILCKYFDRFNFQFICFDECSILRNRNKTYWKVKKLISTLIKNNNLYKILFMTGSPVGKDLYDLYNMFALPGISYKLFGGDLEFKKQYCIMERKYIGRIRIDEIVGYKNVDKFAEIMSEYIIRRRKKDVIKVLPKVISNLCMPELTDFQKKLYDKVVSDTEITSLQKISYLRSICDLPSSVNNKVLERYNIGYTDKRLLNSCKIDTMEDILNNTDEQDKIVIFSASKKVIHYLYEYFGNKYKCIEITGDDSDIEKEEKKKRFNENEDIKLLFATDCISFGANLQSANTMIQFRVSWSSIVDEQRIKRIDRIGQNSSVLNIYNFICKDTIEESVMKILNKNKRFAQKILRDSDIINYIDFKNII